MNKKKLEKIGYKVGYYGASFVFACIVTFFIVVAVLLFGAITQSLF